MSKRKARLLIIGLDGGDPELMEKWVNEGKLPTFKKIIENGVFGRLKSTIPPVTLPAWPTFMTGKNPGKHGITGFFLSKDELSTSYNIKEKGFWEYLESYGLKSIILNMPACYPPKKINGILMSGFLTPQGVNPFNPPQVFNEVRKNVGDFLPDPPSEIINNMHKPKYWKKLVENVKIRSRGFDYLMENYDYDLFVAVYGDPDTVGHRLWGKNNNSGILFIYKEVDVNLSKWIENFDCVFVMSDHGFGGMKKYIRINQILKEMGLLKRVKDEKAKRQGFFLRILKKFNITHETVSKLAGYPIFTQMVKVLPVKELAKIIPSTTKIIDKENTKAYFTLYEGGRGIKVIEKNTNKKKQIMRLIKKKLLSLKDPETGKNIIEAVYYRDEIYKGKGNIKAPELIISPSDGYNINPGFGPKAIADYPKEVGDHKQYGIFLAYGKNIKEHFEIDNAELIDIAPTVVYTYGLKADTDFDGKILKNIFIKNPPPYKSATGKRKISKNNETEKEKASISEAVSRLKI
ncbi:alkaline phosphatase family protein [Candidatus Woesearchaeota archaeon]|nr:alkaline phosphatase family protein [Candidatus Woesearchaeota archaeon]